MHNDTIKKYTYTSLSPGPALLFFGAIHGNEVCGPEAIQRIRNKLDTGKIKLTCGSVTFIPICNPLAYSRNTRFIEENLNRIFKPSLRPASYEARLANTLCSAIDACDVFLDIHSMTANGSPFIFLDFPSKKNDSFAKILGPTLAVTGWPELYARDETEFQSYDTTAYANKKGKIGLLIECGSHTEEKAIDIAEKAILQTMQYWGVTRGTPKKRILKYAKMDRVYFRKGKERMPADWKHFDRVKKGHTLFIEESGAPTKAPYDGYIIMPKPSATSGEALLYLAKENRHTPRD